MIAKGNETIGDLLRFWRKIKRISQLDLALDSGISSKHLSFIETGRSLPSRGVLLKIAHSLKLPLRHRNALLEAAGYVSEYGEASLDDQKMEMVRAAVRRMIDQHEPYPAFVINTSYDILMVNTGYRNLISTLAGDDVLQKYDNSMRLLFSPAGLRPFVKNWDQIEDLLLSRLFDEGVTTQNDDLLKLYNELIGDTSRKGGKDFIGGTHLPFLSLNLRGDTGALSFFTTIATLGTPLDSTAQEVRIELLFPADNTTMRFYDKKNGLQ